MVDGKSGRGHLYGPWISLEKAGKDPIEVLELAMNNVMPVLEVKPRRVGEPPSGAGRGQTIAEPLWDAMAGPVLT